MKAIITGAAGFIGRQLTSHLLAQGVDDLCLFDAHIPQDLRDPGPGVQCIEGELENAGVRARLLDRQFDVIYHLAAVPGGAAEADPGLSRRVNLDATLNLAEEAAAAASCTRFVYTSTIAVLGAPMPEKVDDSSPIAPPLTYGAHKAMVELALADMSRRALVDAVSVRLPGIVARPVAPNGLKSAFMSNLFHALKAGQAFVSPVSPAATVWLMSVGRCADNLVHCALLDSGKMPVGRAVTLPVIRVSMAELVRAITDELGQSADLVSYQPDADIEAVFGAQPPVVTAAAETAGFRNDGSLAQLVQRALANC